MKILLIICLVFILIVGFYYLVKSLVTVGFLTLVGVGVYFWVSKKLINLNE